MYLNKRVCARHETIRPFYVSQTNAAIQCSDAGEYEKALDAYKKFHSTVESENSKIYSQKTTVAQELHEIKINHLYSIQRKNMQIWLGLCVLLILIIVICIIYYQLRLGKIKRIISEQEQSRLQLENENLQKQNSVLVSNSFRCSPSDSSCEIFNRIFSAARFFFSISSSALCLSDSS